MQSPPLVKACPATEKANPRREPGGQVQNLLSGDGSGRSDQFRNFGQAIVVEGYGVVSYHTGVPFAVAARALKDDIVRGR
jgi:hypothetical protein